MISYGRDRVFMDVEVERHRQEAKWGEQSHPDGTHERYESARDRYRNECEDAFRVRGDGSWRHIFLEEVFEAMTETDPVKLREELIQALAVATAWVEAIDRRRE